MFLTVPILIFGFTGILNSTAGKQKPVKTYNGKATVEIIDVSKNLANKIQLHLVKDKETGKIIKESSYSSLQGFVMGLEWQHLELLEHKNEIEVSGILKYKFMGNDIISSFESFVLKDFNPDFN